DPTDNGPYTVSVQSNQVADTQGNFVLAGPLGTFNINIPDTSAPTASIAGSDLNPSDPTTYTVRIRYADNIPVNLPTLRHDVILVAGPNGSPELASFISADASTNSPTCVATYAISPLPGTQLQNGVYTIVVQSQQVADTSGNPLAHATLGTILVSMPPNNQN